LYWNNKNTRRRMLEKVNSSLDASDEDISAEVRED